MSIFKMPSLGADMETGTLMEWKVEEGETVKKGQVIAEVESSKGVIEVEVFEEGVIEKLLVKPGTICDVGTPIAVIRDENETDDAFKNELASVTGEISIEEGVSAKLSKEEEKRLAKEETQKETAAEKEEKPKQKSKKKTSEHEIKISPAARKKAEDLGVDLDVLAARTEGKIGISEVEEAAASSGGKKQGGSNTMRQAIAAAMSRSNAEIPHYYLSTSINMTPALEWLAEQNSKRSIKDRILPAALTIRAVVKALQAVPELNGFWKDDALQMSEEVNPGVAIARRTGGLVTPALLGAQEMNLDQTMKAFHDLITRTRSGKLRSSEITQQTIVITNLGDLGVERVYGVIYPPQVALVGLGRIVDAPWAEGDALAVRKIMQATLAGDHRATDGRTGALFLDKLDQILQKPEEL